MYHRTNVTPGRIWVFNMNVMRIFSENIPPGGTRARLYI